MATPVAPLPPPRQSFYLNRAFGFFWLGQSVSTLGSQVTAFAVPLLAAITLHATPLQMGLLRAAEFAPFLIFTLPAGFWADFGIRRLLMVCTNLVQGFAIVLVPIAVLAGLLRLEVLYLLMFVMGSLKTVFEMAYQTYVPELVERDQLVTANSRIMLSYSLGQSAGPGFAGLLVEWLGAPVAVLIDAFSYLICALSIFQIDRQETRRFKPPHLMAREIVDGFRMVATQPHIRALLWLLSLNNLFMNALMAVLVLFVTRELGVRPGLFGVIVSLGGLGAISGALGAERFGAKVGPGRVVIFACLLAALAALCFPAIPGGSGLKVVWLTAAYFFLSMGGSAITVYAWTIRQLLTPRQVLGRMNGAFRFAVTGVMPFGAVLGGWLGGCMGIRHTLVLLACCWVFSCLLACLSPLWTLRNLPSSTASPA
ncbi:MAG TPA: MFS transporter [Chthoniobacterales bacterium]